MTQGPRSGVLLSHQHSQESAKQTIPLVIPGLMDNHIHGLHLRPAAIAHLPEGHSGHVKLCLVPLWDLSWDGGGRTWTPEFPRT
jgi:hypothetical protein